MDKEFDYWMTNRTTKININGKNHKLARYNVEVDDPRPESYYEDFNDAQHFDTVDEQREFYQNMKSGAESGWDYSTKWFFKKDGSSSQDLKDVQTRHIIPVELNSYLCRNAKIMQNFHKMIGNDKKAQDYANIYENFKLSIDSVLWNEDFGAYFDYKILHSEQNTNFFPSNVAPLWADCYMKSKNRVEKIINYIETSSAFDYPGGVPTSMVKSGQQWDFSNAWAPLQELIVTGLENTLDPKAKKLAFGLVDKWLQNVYVSYVQSGRKMFEKYDVEQIGLPGGGGEYEVQEGFGWSNGVLLHFLNTYNDLISPEISGIAPIPKMSIFLVPIILLIMII